MSAAKAGLAPDRLLWTALAVLLGLAYALLPIVPGDSGVKAGFATVVVTVVLLATGMVPGLVTAGVFFFMALVTQAAPVWVLASGFWSNAIMLIFGGLVMGAAAERSGFGRYVARGLMQRFLGSYPRLLTGIMLGTAALSLLVPSTMGRLAITIPVVLATLKEAGYEEGSNGYVGAILVTVAGNFMTSYAILPANLVQIITLGAIEAVHGPQATYAEYLLLTGPVLGLAKGATFIALVLWLLPASSPAPASGPGEPVVLSGAARRLGLVLGLAVSMWATDFLHGLKPGWIALGAGLLCILPPLALVGLKESFDRNRLTGIVTVPMLLGVASVITHSGAGQVLIDAVTAAIPLAGRSPAYGFAVLAVLAAVIAIVATTVGCIAIMTPIVTQVVVATGLSAKLGAVAVLTGLQALFFHYEAAPVMVGLLMGRVGARPAARFLVPLAIIGLVLILPLEILWLKLIGYLP
ncbi:MAG: SLC13 family permease [Hyphomicrobiaceae bacterium]